MSKRILSILLIFCIAFATVSTWILFLIPNEAKAAADIQVSKNSTGSALLGGEATFTITVENVGDEKGYNLNIIDTFGSSRPDPEGQVSIVSISDDYGALDPTQVNLNSDTGDLEISFVDIKDLAPGEIYHITITVDTSGDSSWQVGDEITNTVFAEAYELPDGTGDSYNSTDATSTDLIPIDLIKSANQSTHVEQATGTLEHPYSYTLTIENNEVNPTDNVVVSDILPDGVEYLGMASGPDPDSGFPQRDPLTGETFIQWTIGTINPGETIDITYSTGIRYDYYGTANGGTNRDHDDFDGDPVLGTPIEDKTVLTNFASLSADYFEIPVSDIEESSVTAAYATVEKTASPTVGGNGTEIFYELNYTASEYYSILDNENLLIYDLLPDGQTYQDNANPAPSSWQENADGTTDIFWDNTVIGPIDAGRSITINFSAIVDLTWTNGDDVLSGDRMVNNVYTEGEWEDQVDTSRENEITESHDSAAFAVALPQVTKEVEDPDNPGTWIDSTDATVGDVLRFRVRFNTTDGATPTVPNIIMGDITVTDWLPLGMVYNDDSISSYSNAGHFIDPDSGDGIDLNLDGPPELVGLNEFDGIEWYLGNVQNGGWWEAIFTATVVDDQVEVYNGRNVNNYFKSTGYNSFGEAYSSRDLVPIDYIEPILELEKEATAMNPNITAGSTVEYTVTVENIGMSTAYNVLVRDTLDENMWDTEPVITSIDLDGANLIEDTDYKLNPAYDPMTGEWYVDLYDNTAPAVNTSIEPGSALTIVYEATLNAGYIPVAGMTLDNIASTSYNSQEDTSGREYSMTEDPADLNTDDEQIQLPPVTISKSGPDGPYTIGDTFTYQLDITVPGESVVFWPEVTDILNHDGFEYVLSSTRIEDAFGNPPIGAGFDAATNPDPVIGGGDNQTILTWYLNNPIDNRGQTDPYIFRIFFDVVVTGEEDDGTWEYFLPNENNEVTNAASVSWNTSNPVNRETNISRDSNEVVTAIDQPLLDLEKSIITQCPFFAGSKVEYQLEITNVGESTAYDINIEDNMPEFLSSPEIISVTHSDLGQLYYGIHYTNNFSGDPIYFDFDGGASEVTLEIGETITIVYQGIITDDVEEGTSLINIADADWTSLPDGYENRRQYNDNPYESDWVEDTDSDSLNTDDISNITVSKEADPKNGSVLMPGDQITYTLNYENLSSGDLHDFEIEDILEPGLEYLPETIIVDGVEQTDAQDDDLAYYNEEDSTIFVNFSILSQGASGTISYDVLILDNEHSINGIENYATYRADELTDQRTNVTEHYIDPVEIYKTVSDVNGGQVRPGDELLWSIRIVNVGVVDATGVVVTDSVPEHTAYVLNSITGQGADDSGDPSLVWNVGILAPQEEMILTFKSVINENIPDGTTITNQAMVDTDYSDPVYSDDSTTPNRRGDATLIQTSFSGLYSSLIGLMIIVLILIINYNPKILNYFGGSSKKLVPIGPTEPNSDHKIRETAENSTSIRSKATLEEILTAPSINNSPIIKVKVVQKKKTKKEREMEKILDVIRLNGGEAQKKEIVKVLSEKMPQWKIGKLLVELKKVQKLKFVGNPKVTRGAHVGHYAIIV